METSDLIALMALMWAVFSVILGAAVLIAWKASNTLTGIKSELSEHHDQMSAHIEQCDKDRAELRDEMVKLKPA